MDERLEDLRQQLDRKTTEIESFVAAKQGLGSVGSMEPAEYDRLQHDVEELLERWEESAQEGPADMEDSQLSKLIAERYAIEQAIVAAKGETAKIIGTRNWRMRELVRTIGLNAVDISLSEILSRDA